MSQGYFDLLNRPIFLHFLNREICETENVQFSDDELQSIVMMAMLSTTSFVYIGHAIVLENMARYPKTTSILMEMEKYGYICLVGNAFSINNFLSRRRELYRYDKKKYNVYFEDKIDSLPWPQNPIITNVDTTKILSKTFIKIANDMAVADELKTYSLDKKDKEKLAEKMEYQKRRKIAVTKKLFAKSKISREGKVRIHRLIIQIYNKRYVEEFEGVYVTGIAGLTYYDRFQKTDIFYNYIIMREVLRDLKIFSDNFSCEAEQIIKFRENENFKILLLEIRKFLSGIAEMGYALSKSLTFIRRVLNNRFNKDDTCEEIFMKLWNISLRLGEKDEQFRKGYEQVEESFKKVLVLSASVLEYRVLRKCARNRGFDFQDKDTNLDDFSYAECMPKNGVKVFLARTDMGALNAAHTLEMLSNRIAPDFVIVGGICVGLRKDEQKIAQLIISRQIHDYDLKKISNGKRILRGVTLPANRYLYDKCILESYDMAEDEYDEGLMLSANVLVNDENLVQQMVADKPDAIGYEMEGSGISYISNIFRNRWIMVKAISDWGFKKENYRQEEAAEKSYKFIFNVIEKRMQF